MPGGGLPSALTLRKPWQVGEHLDAGGFGDVYEATGSAGEQAVVKFIPKIPGAQRELLFEDLSGIPGVVPIWDTGEWGDYWVVVMPRAEKSLHRYLEQVGGRLPEPEAAAILTDLAEALAAFAPTIVHRDISARNVLLLAGRWCISDFGIARYAEATTAPDTLKFALSPPYAAPERWRAERATPAADVYSLGVLGYEMVAGTYPFPGPTNEDYQEQHISTVPAAPDGASPALAALLLQCLLKPAGSRPTPTALVSALRNLSSPVSAAQARLQAINQRAVEIQSDEAARQAASQSREALRRELARTGGEILREIGTDLKARIKNAAPSAVEDTPDGSGGWGIRRSGPGWTLRLLDARLVFAEAEPTKTGVWREFPPAFDVVAHAGIAVEFKAPEHQWRGRAHSLWYCDAKEPDVFRWYETAFVHGVFTGLAQVIQPFDRDPGPEAGAALRPIIGERLSLDWSFTPIDQNDRDGFIERWLGWLADAAAGQLQQPHGWPEHQVAGSYRN